MNRTKILWIPALITLLALLGAFVIVATAPSVESRPEERVIPTVRTIAAEPTTLRYRVRTQGTVEPRTEADLIPEVSGRVVWISPVLVAGGFFDEGEPLLRLERRDFELAVQRQRAQLRRARGEYDHAASELERRQGLSDAGVASASQLSDARRAAAVAEAILLDAKAALEQAERDLARSEIKAPFDGRVREEQVDVGQFVTRGSPIARLYATDYAEIRLPIPDEELAYLDFPDPRRLDTAHASDTPGPSVILSASFAGRRHEWTGRIVRTEGEIDMRSRMVNVVARVDEPYRKNDVARPPLAVGLFVEAEILGPQVSDVIVVPRHAMREDSKILVVDAQDELHTRSVEVLRIDRDEVLVKGPLPAGERICVSPVQVVVEGMAVHTVQDPSDAPAASTSPAAPAVPAAAEPTRS
ncbi:MAG: efflux RND transporter periplasmic adaptor subunit [Myxococcota bacterium]